MSVPHMKSVGTDDCASSFELRKRAVAGRRRAASEAADRSIWKGQGGLWTACFAGESGHFVSCEALRD